MALGDPTGRELTQNARVTATANQINWYKEAVKKFYDSYHALPGDLADAGNQLAVCTGTNGSDCNPSPASAGDNIIGSPDFIKTIKSLAGGRVTVPAASAADEAVLFWTHLLKAKLISDVTEDGMKNASPFAIGTTFPLAKIGGGLIVGYSDGTPLPKSLSPANDGLSGTVLVQISDEVLQGKTEMNESDKQALLPIKAAQIDRRMDDGRPDSGEVQAYGAPECFMIAKDGRPAYNEQLTERDCGLIYKIADSPKGVIPKKRSD